MISWVRTAGLRNDISSQVFRQCFDTFYWVHLDGKFVQHTNERTLDTQIYIPILLLHVSMLFTSCSGYFKPKGRNLLQYHTNYNNNLYCITAFIQVVSKYSLLNPLNAELNPICHLLALLAHHFLHVSRIRVKSLTLRLLSYIYIYIYIWSTYS